MPEYEATLTLKKLSGYLEHFYKKKEMNIYKPDRFRCFQLF